MAMYSELDACKQAAENKRIIREFVAAINHQDWEKLAQVVTPDFVRHSSAAGQPGIKSREDLIKFLSNEFTIFPDAHETIEDLIAEGQKVAARQRFTGTQTGPMGLFPASGKRMTATYLAIYRLEAGRIVEAWVEWDNLNGLIQLGHYVAPSQSVEVSEHTQQYVNECKSIDN
ncbi:ester cyclase [Leptolyngbya sp. NK1-12]|nr:ester cyclase [Leptolyngbya sp. NK1-12]